MPSRFSSLLSKSRSRFTPQLSRSLRKIPLLLVLVFIATFATLATTRSANAQQAQLKVRGAVKYVHGINSAWFFNRYSTDIGFNPLHTDWGCGYNQSAINATLDDIKRMKVNVVRVWLFEDMEGLDFDSNGYVSGVQSTFLANLDGLVSAANARNLSLYFTFLNHNLSSQVGQTLPNGATIKNVVADDMARQRFLDNAVWNIAYRYRSNAAIFGYDLINESNIGTGNGSYSFSQMRSFAIDGANKVHAAAPGTQVTMSTQWYAFGDQSNHPYWYGGLGLDFYDYHEYNDAPDLAAKPSWLDKPLLLGEYGPNTWTEASMNDVGSTCLWQARDRGWAGTIAWGYYQSDNDPMNISWATGGNRNWKSLGWTLQWYGEQFGTG